MQKCVILLLKLLALLILTNIYQSCTKWVESTVKIERFNYLDDHYSGVNTDDSLLVEAYLIHGYRKKFDDNIQKITDKYVCDSIIPNSRFHRARYITFFQKTENTNTKNFEVSPKHKSIYARTNDKLFSYRIKEYNSAIGKITKTYHHIRKNEVSFQDFYCR